MISEFISEGLPGKDQEYVWSQEVIAWKSAGKLFPNLKLISDDPTHLIVPDLTSWPGKNLLNLTDLIFSYHMQQKCVEIWKNW